MRGLIAVACSLAVLAGTPHAVSALSLLPQPEHLAPVRCAHPLSLAHGIAFPSGADAGGREIVEDRWRALGIGETRSPGAPRVLIRRGMPSPAQSYRLRVDDGGVSIEARDAGGEFDAEATLAQLPQRTGAGWSLPCVAIEDRPALRWRIVMDDVSRGPLPTMRYFKERVRTLAGFKINGYSPYMEQVFVDAAHPAVAPDDGITPAQLGELARYARRFHVALIPQQQTFAHMHETLKWEQFAALAVLPHGWLMNPGDTATYAFLRPLLAEEAAAAGPVPFFALGADEPIDLGRGASTALVEREGLAAVFAGHVTATEALLPRSAGRPMIWDDAVQRDPSILAHIPRSTVIVDFHYGAEKSFLGYIKPVAAAGFDQMVSPGANNWNEFYPLLDVATANIGRFVADGEASNVLGMYMTVWHDDGESLYEATWFPLAYAAAASWERAPVERAAFERRFGDVFFGIDGPRYAADFDMLADAQRRLAPGEDRDPSHYLYWSDPFAPALTGRLPAADARAIRLDAEAILAHLRTTHPPLHANAADVLALAARSYDALARRFQIVTEAHSYYDDARDHADGKHDGIVYRGLNVAKYLCWEARDNTLDLERRYRAAWDYESRPSGRARALIRYPADAELWLRYADRLNTVQREDYYRNHRLPSFDDALGVR